MSDHMEIERKYLVQSLPPQLEAYPHTQIEQGYLCTAPVVRIRRDGDAYYLTYKGGGMMMREEYNLPLTAQAYSHLLPKADGGIISKTRYRIPLSDGLTAELDVFHGFMEGLIMVEVEFPDLHTAQTYTPPSWFGPDVTQDSRYHNSSMSQGICPPFSIETK